MRRVKGMGIPVIPKRTEYISAGAVTFGVEVRVLNYETATAAYAGNQEKLAMLADMKKNGVALDDGGVSLHVFGHRGGGPAEYLRFDCFAQDPHYHYMLPERDIHYRLELEDTARGDPLGWALNSLKTKLAAMLADAGAVDLAAQVDPREIETAMPEVLRAVEQAMQGAA